MRALGIFLMSLLLLGCPNNSNDSKNNDGNNKLTALQGEYQGNFTLPPACVGTLQLDLKEVSNCNWQWNTGVCVPSFFSGACRVNGSSLAVDVDLGNGMRTLNYSYQLSGDILTLTNVGDNLETVTLTRQ